MNKTNTWWCLVNTICKTSYKMWNCSLIFHRLHCVYVRTVAHSFNDSHVLAITKAKQPNEYHCKFVYSIQWFAISFSSMCTCLFRSLHFLSNAKLKLNLKLQVVKVASFSLPQNLATHWFILNCHRFKREWEIANFKKKTSTKLHLRNPQKHVQFSQDKN